MFKRLNDEGTTIVQVTHSEVNAEYGNRIVRLEDGWIAKTESPRLIESLKSGAEILRSEISDFGS